jgi:hypothetical protein
MEPGVDFAATIQAAVGSCGVLVALIGEEWLTVVDAQGNRRIDDPADVHRMELQAALNRGVRLIPALVQDAEMPTASELPDALRPLVGRQAFELSDGRWDYDVGRLVTVLERVLTDAAEEGRSTPRQARTSPSRSAAWCACSRTTGSAGRASSSTATSGTRSRSRRAPPGSATTAETATCGTPARATAAAFRSTTAAPTS